MTAIQAVYIRSYSERIIPKPHIVYQISIESSVRSWNMFRRYSEFVELHTELTQSTGAAPPAPIPPKHPLSAATGILTFGIVKGGDKDEKAIEERRVGLEAYLRAIVSAKDDRWRESYTFKEFLGVPIGKQDNFASSSSGARFSSSSWLDEHLELQSRIRDIRASINKRDALSDRGDINGSHAANVQGKKQLAEVLSRLRVLGTGLQELGMGGMKEGELQRRTDMVGRLQDDCEKLGKMVTVARHTSRLSEGGGAGTSSGKTLAPDSDRVALLGTPAFHKPARIFGSAQPQETDVTRPLDNVGVFQLQKQQMELQDEQAARLTTILQRQRQLGEAIGAELNVQNEMLDDLSNAVDNTGGKLTAAKRQMNRLG